MNVLMLIKVYMMRLDLYWMFSSVYCGMFISLEKYVIGWDSGIIMGYKWKLVKEYILGQLLHCFRVITEQNCLLIKTHGSNTLSVFIRFSSTKTQPLSFVFYW